MTLTLTPTDTALADRRARQRAAILADLAALDSRRARPLGATMMAWGSGMPPDQADLDALRTVEAEAYDLRCRLAEVDGRAAPSRPAYFTPVVG